MTDRNGHGGHSPTDQQPGYELSDISTKVVVMFATALVVAGIVIHLLVWLLYVYFGHVASVTYSRQYPLSSVGPAPLPAAPMLQVRPRDELKQLRADEEAILTSYGWVDSSAGIVRIPIDRAMQLVLQRGLPTRTPGDMTAGAPDDAKAAQRGTAAAPERK
jgi:hypothetical protein